MHGEKPMLAKYSLGRTVNGTVAGPEHRILIEIPEGSIVALVGPVVDGPQFLDTQWEAHTARIFASDLEATVTPEKTASFAAGTGIADASTHQTDLVQSAAVKVRRFNSAGREL
jgi:hypothetical protein